MIVQDIMYIEKSSPNHSGESHIGKISYSKTKTTIYYKALTLRKIKGFSCSGNYQDVNTEEKYWISGVKKSGSNRHWAAKGNKKGSY